MSKCETNGKYKNPTASMGLVNLYLDDDTTDVNFIFRLDDDDSTESVSAHKTLLAAASDVFKAMFYGELKEKGDVKIAGVTADAFTEFLQFFYLNEVELTIENIADVMGLGHKYNVTYCFDTCVQFLKDKLSGDNACLGYGLAILYEHDKLRKLCESQIVMNTEAVFKSKYFLEANRRILTDILNMEMLSCSEVDVFEACMAWVKSVSKQNDLTKEIVQTQLGDLFHNIRFTSMTITEFCTLYRSYGNVFTLSEFNDITQMIVLPDYTSNIFDNKSRHISWSADDSVKCNRITSAEKEYDYISFTMKNIEKTTFSTNKPVLLGQFTCANLFLFRDGQYHELQSKIPIEITIVEVLKTKYTAKANSWTLSNFKASLECKSETVIFLPEPVLAKPGYTYEIRIELFKKNHGFKYQFLKTIVGIDSDTVITFHNDTPHGDGVVGLITALDFKALN